MFADELFKAKLLADKTEVVYVITSEAYADQGFFKVGRTKSTTARAVSCVLHATVNKKLKPSLAKYPNMTETNANKLMTVMEWVAATNYPIDKFALDKFWYSLQEGQLIYVDDALVQWMGYSDTEARKRKGRFVRLLVAEAKPGVDYYEFSNNEYITFLSDHEKTRKNSVSLIGDTDFYTPVDQSHGKNPTKHLLLTPDCLRGVMLRLNTVKAGQIRAYYIALEKLFRAYVIYQNNYRVEEQNVAIRAREQENIAQVEALAQQLEATKISANAIAQELANTKVVADELFKAKLFGDKTEVVYIMTSNTYADQGLFKVGRTKTPRSRTVQLNSGRTEGDRLFVVNEFKTGSSTQLEVRVHYLLKNFRDTTQREFFHIPYKILYDIMVDFSNDLDVEEEKVNVIVQRLYDLQKVSPGLIKWREGMPALIDTDEEKITPAGDMGNTDETKIAPPTDAHEHVDVPTAPVPVAPPKLLTSALMTEAEIIAIITKVIHEVALAGMARQKDISDGIKKALPRGRKTKYKFSQWKDYIVKLAKDLGIIIKSRA